jgi:hypothetical protein
MPLPIGPIAHPSRSRSPGPCRSMAKAYPAVRAVCVAGSASGAGSERCVALHRLCRAAERIRDGAQIRGSGAASRRLADANASIRLQKQKTLLSGGRLGNGSCLKCSEIHPATLAEVETETSIICRTGIGDTRSRAPSSARSSRSFPEPSSSGRSGSPEALQALQVVATRACWRVALNATTPQTTGGR